MKQTNERLCALAQKGDAAALDSLIDNNKSFIGKVANDLFRSMNLAQSGLNLDTDDLKQAGNLGLWKTVPKFDAARGMKFLTYAAPAIRNAMMDMVRDAFAAPNHENPNLFSIGEGLGFFVFFGNENNGSSLTAVCPKPYQKKDRITKVTTVRVP